MICLETYSEFESDPTFEFETIRLLRYPPHFYTKLIIENLPREIAEKNSFCDICLEDIRVDDEQFTLSCKHVYHFECIRRWFLESTITCPKCRNDENKYVTKLCSKF